MTGRLAFRRSKATTISVGGPFHAEGGAGFAEGSERIEAEGGHLEVGFRSFTRVRPESQLDAEDKGQTDYRG